MMSLLHQFAALSLISGVMMTLLPDGSLRRTARMVVGLLMLLSWADGLADLMQIPVTAALPSTVLSPAGASVEEAQSAAAAALQAQWEVVP
ncbi:MAG: hypothetical protein IJ438_03345 [Clostridia bacterium]|nr:hypothetical protein [Clostridia bacterium]